MSLLSRFFIVVLLLSLLGSACGSSTIGSSRIVVSNSTSTLAKSTAQVNKYSTSLPVTGEVSWIYNCERGLSAYRQNHSVGGKAQDVFLYGDFYINQQNGSVESSNDPCVQQVISYVHSVGAKVNGVLVFGTSQADQNAYYMQNVANGSFSLDSIVQALQNGHYDGLIGDFETLAPSKANLFTQFSAAVYSKLKGRYLWGQALIHKTNQDQSIVWLNGFQDWAGLANTVDYFVVMAIDEYISSESHPNSTHPKPITGGDWLKEIVQNAKDTIPTMLGKIVWEFALYYSWWYKDSSGIWLPVSGYSYTYKELQQRLSHYDTLPPANQLENHPNGDAPYIHFIGNDGNEYYVYYETPDSLRLLTEELTRYVGSSVNCVREANWVRDQDEPAGVWNILDTDSHINFCTS